MNEWLDERVKEQEAKAEAVPTVVITKGPQGIGYKFENCPDPTLVLDMLNATTEHFRVQLAVNHVAQAFGLRPNQSPAGIVMPLGVKPPFPVRP